MRDDNSRMREKFELSLDGRQVASIVVGALVIVGVVFVLGLNVGKQIAIRRADAGRPGDLEALDHAPVPPAAARDESITFYDRLPKAKPAPPAPASPPPAPAARAEPAPQAPAQPGPTPEVAVAQPAAPAADPVADRAPTPTVPVSAGKGTPDSASGGWCVQLAASPTRAEAERLAARHRNLSPRIEPADVPGKGRFFRVRVGRFDTKEAAERYRKDVARETGSKGFVTASR